jgi:hypothetical protein
VEAAWAPACADREAPEAEDGGRGATGSFARGEGRSSGGAGAGEATGTGRATATGAGTGTGAATGGGAGVGAAALNRAPQNLQKSAPGSVMPRHRGHTEAAGAGVGVGADATLGGGGGGAVAPIEAPHPWQKRLSLGFRSPHRPQSRSPVGWSPRDVESWGCAGLPMFAWVEAIAVGTRGAPPPGSAVAASSGVGVGAAMRGACVRKVMPQSRQ